MGHILDPFSSERIARFHDNPIIRRAKIPLIATDVALCTLVWNEAMEEMTQIAEGAVRGYPLHIALPHILTNNALPRLVATIMKGEPSTSRHWAAYASGVYCVYEAQRRPVYDPEGRVEGAVIAVNWYRPVAPFDWLVDPKDLEIPEEGGQCGVF